ncbi:MAG: PIN domain-containing protein [Actinomycetota bacterium]
MITAVDTNVLLDVFGADHSFGPRSADAIRACMREGSLIACDVVWAEVAASFRSADAVEDAMERLGVGFSSLAMSSALAAGAAWARYRRRGGRRDRVIADFLIGAHATAVADRLLTRDRGFYRSYFGSLSLIDPSER